MSKVLYQRAEKRTIYFIGVTTEKSSIMRIFPEWVKYLNLGDCIIRGIDFEQHDEPEKYREAVRHIKSDELSLGSLITTHKIDLFNACRDMFEELDEYAELMGEISCISKSNGKLVGYAKDPIASGLALESFLPEGYWEKTGAEVFVIGAGGSAIATTWYLMKKEHGVNRPSKIIVSNRSTPRLGEVQKIHKKLRGDVPCEYHHTPKPQENDKIVNMLKPYSMVVNATGLGKDAPGSPVTDAAVFPENGIAWDFNYRGNLIFLAQAHAQQKKRNLRIEDGWVYFIHGWTQVIAEVFHIMIPSRGEEFDEICRIAEQFRR